MAVLTVASELNCVLVLLAVGAAGKNSSVVLIAISNNKANTDVGQQVNSQ